MWLRGLGANQKKASRDEIPQLTMATGWLGGKGAGSLLFARSARGNETPSCSTSFTIVQHRLQRG
jgi:hypothetical protein